MRSRRRPLLATTLTLGSFALVATAACGAPDPEDATGASADLARSAICPEELERCGYTITYPDHGESSVEVRGDFGDGVAWATGTPMTRSGGVWKADVTIPYGKAVQYKFVVNGSTWKIDPAQPKTADGQ